MKANANRAAGDGSSGRFRVAVWSPSKPLERALGDLIRGIADVESLGSFDGRSPEAVSLAADLLILDVDGSPSGAGALIRGIRAASDTRVIAVSAHSERRLVERALEVGALGYVLKDTAFHDLSAALLSVARGECYVSPGITGPSFGTARRDSRGSRSGGA